MNISMLELRLDRALSLFSTQLPVNHWQQYYSQTPSLNNQDSRSS